MPRAVRWLGFALPALLVSALACHPGPIDPVLQRRLDTRLRNIEPLDLERVTVEPPTPIEKALTQQLERVPTSQPAEQRVEIDVAEVRLATLQNNLDLNVVRVDPSIAQTFVSEAEAKFDALITLNLTREYQDLPRIDDEIVPITRDAQQNDLFKYKAGLEVPLQTGGKIKLDGLWDKKKLDLETKKGQYLAGLNFSISQPLLRGAGIDVNVAPIRLARYNASVVDTQTMLAAIKVLAIAEKAYWKVYGAWKKLEVVRDQYNLAFDNLEVVRRLVEEGRRAEIEALRATVGVTDRLEGLIAATYDLRRKQRDLERVMFGEIRDVRAEQVVVPITDPQLVGFVFDYDQLATQALESRLELLELELKLAADQVKIDYARNQVLPLATLEYEYSNLARGDGFGDAFDNFWDYQYAGWMVGLRVEMPVTNELRKSQLRRAIYGRLRRLATKEARRLTVEQEVYDALDTLKESWQRILAARQNVAFTGVNYQAEKKQFELGARTQIEVLEALTRLGSAQLREIDAIVAYQLAQIDLAFATGTLLGYAHVAMEPIPLDGLYSDTPPVLRNQN